MSNINKILDKITNVLKWTSAMILSIMLVVTFVQVVLRYVFNNPIMWAEEVTLVMLIWFGYLAISIVSHEDNHIALEAFYNMANKPIKKALDVIRHLLMIGFSVLMTYFGIEMMGNAQGKFLPASQLSRTMLYIPLIVSGGLIVLYSITLLVKLFVTPEEREVR